MTVQGLLGDPEVVTGVGTVDMVLLFDVLLHQVAPDWRRLLALYAPHASTVVVFNPQWVGPGQGFRLVDLGPDRYFELVPHEPTEPAYDTFFARLDEDFPAHRRKVRDVHYAWQWAITDAELCDEMARLGFATELRRDHGAFGQSKWFARRGFVFRRVAGRSR